MKDDFSKLKCNDNPPIVLNKYGSAILLAEMECPFHCPNEISVKFVPITVNVNGKNIQASSPKVKRLMDKEEYRKARYEYENKRIKFIYDKLKEDYPDDDYAEKFLNSNETQNWLKPFIDHTEQSLKCEFLKEDKCHCNRPSKERGTSCYTCCFKCQLNEYCKNACIYR